MSKLIWQSIESDHSNHLDRTRVPWGWLVMSTDDVMTPVNTGYSLPETFTGYEWRTSITFVFDPFHKWLKHEKNKGKTK